ncbi:phage tail protein [Dyella dinghuensis]|uniref:Phage tail protein n=1 Tax=Dyella dinghuensis TaxID=1920169 RepID=A0A3S0PY44_9GAMM|nr:tail fiber protein [Dyella dinghuensis]RUL63397.1 phage tail protein [Dyella dinghuensis]
MTTPYLGEVQIFGFNYAPYQWAICAGQLMPIQQNTALFSLLGTNFGGDGKSNFGLPNYGGTTACGQGQGPGLTQRVVGESFGSESVTLLQSEIPGHNHTLNLHGQQDQSLRHGIPANGDFLLLPANATPFVSQPQPNVNFAPSMIGTAGQGQPHENRQPLLALNFCIALSGLFPPRP